MDQANKYYSTKVRKIIMSHLGEHHFTIIASYSFTLLVLITIIAQSYFKSRKIRRLLEKQIDEKK